MSKEKILRWAKIVVLSFLGGGVLIVLVAITLDAYQRSGFSVPREIVSVSENIDFAAKKAALEAKCRKGGAVIRYVGGSCSGCGYERAFNRGEKMMCLTMLELGCLCPPSECWNGASCEKL